MINFSWRIWSVIKALFRIINVVECRSWLVCNLSFVLDTERHPCTFRHECTHLVYTSALAQYASECIRYAFAASSPFIFGIIEYAGEETPLSCSMVHMREKPDVVETFRCTPHKTPPSSPNNIYLNERVTFL